MKAILPGSAADSDKPVVLGETAEPEPADDEAVIAVEAYSVNRGETFQLDGGLDRRWAGWRPGKDIAGTVTRPAADGSGPVEGARVVAHPPAYGWAERVAVPTHSLAELPDSVDAVTAAALPWRGSPRCGCCGPPGRSQAARCCSPAPAAGSAITSPNWPRPPARCSPRSAPPPNAVRSSCSWVPRSWSPRWRRRGGPTTWCWSRSAATACPPPWPSWPPAACWSGSARPAAPRHPGLLQLLQGSEPGPHRALRLHDLGYDVRPGPDRPGPPRRRMAVSTPKSASCATGPTPPTSSPTCADARSAATRCSPSADTNPVHDRSAVADRITKRRHR